MNKEHLSEYIGNIDDRLVEQAEQIPDYKRQYQQKRIKRFMAAAAVFVLMVCSFSAGAIVSAHEQETVTLEEIGLTMILPDSWSGTYSVEKDGQNYKIYNKEIRKKMSNWSGTFEGGVLFNIVCYEEAMTPEQFVENGYDFTNYRYLFSTKDSTYILYYASDVQWDPNDSEQETIYQQMAAEIEDIRFVVDNALAK